MKQVKFDGHFVGEIGFGLMGLTWRANPPSQEQCFQTMKAALDSGANLWNAGELYGTPDRNSLHLLKEYFDKYPEDASKVFISIKGGMQRGSMIPDGSEKNTRRSIVECLTVMSNKHLDLWEAARVDPETAIETTIRAAHEFVKAGQLGGISLSECSAASIRRAAKVTEVKAVEVEFSLWETTILENGVAQTCAELDIPIIAYSPLGKGFLTGQVKKPEDIPEDDYRRALPRFQGQNFHKNLELVREVENIAQRKGATAGQVALAWIRAQSNRTEMPLFIPIPGASSAERVKENMHVVELSDDEFWELEARRVTASIVGDRYNASLMHLNFGDSPQP